MINICVNHFVSFLIIILFFSVTKLNMITPKVWFKLVNPKDNWTKVSLEEVEDVDDLKKKIKIEMAPKLDTFTSSSLTLKATHKNGSPNEAMELHAKDKLVSVLKRFNIE